MLCPITKNFKIYALAGLVALVFGGALGDVNSSFAETTTNADIIMTIDTSEGFDETEIFNYMLLTAAFVATNGNVEIVAMDRHTICISARSDSGGCSRHVSQGSRQEGMDAESHDEGVTIFSTYDQ